MGDKPGLAWSSAAAAYVPDTSDDVTGATIERLTRIATEAELDAVLRSHGMPSPVITANDVRTEAQRRIIAATGASDLAGCMTKQLNATMRAIELTRKQLATGLTEAEFAEAALLQALADKIKAIRAASNLIEGNPPADYADNSRWPA